MGSFYAPITKAVRALERLCHVFLVIGSQPETWKLSMGGVNGKHMVICRITNRGSIKLKRSTKSRLWVYLDFLEMVMTFEPVMMKRPTLILYYYDRTNFRKKMFQIRFERLQDAVLVRITYLLLV